MELIVRKRGSTGSKFMQHKATSSTERVARLLQVIP